MIGHLLALSLLAAPAPLLAQETEIPELTMDQTASLRCGVAFGMVAGGQEQGDARALAFPPMEPRGKEFFVRTLALIMEQHGLSREQTLALAMGQMGELAAEGYEGVAEIMPACLLMLEASGI